MTPGQELLRALLRGDAAPARAPWDALAATTPPALQPYVAYLLDAGQLLDRLPNADRVNLSSARRDAVVQYVGRRAALRHALDATRQAGIPTVVLKGGALAELAYPDPALRTMTDLDLWVPAEAFADAMAALLGAGFGYSARLPPLAQTDYGPLERRLELAATHTMVEVHGRLRSLELLPADRVTSMWQRRRAANLGGIAAHVLDPRDALLHLALHCGALHKFSAGLGPLLDIALLVRRDPSAWDWPLQAAEYQSLGVAPWVRVALSLSREFAAAAVPDTLFDALPRPTEVAEMERVAREQVLEPANALPWVVDRIARLDGFTSRARWVGRWLRQRFAGYRAGGFAYAARRLVHDATVKLPGYVRGIFSGRLRGAELQRRVAVARRQERLDALAAAAQRAAQPATNL